MEFDFWPNFGLLHSRSTGFTRPAWFMDGDGESKSKLSWHMVRARFHFIIPTVRSAHGHFSTRRVKSCWKERGRRRKQDSAGKARGQLVP